MLNNDVLIQVHEIRGYPEDFITEVIYEFPDGNTFNERMSIRDRMITFRCMLEALAHLQENKKSHGDVRPAYIYYQETECWAKLADRLGDPCTPLQCQLGNIRAKNKLYMPPRIFVELVNQNPRIKHNAYKTDLFALGLTTLETFCSPELIQSLYDYENLQFNYNGIVAICEKLLEIAEEEPTKAFVLFLREACLQEDEARMLTPKEGLSLIKNIKELKPIWELVFYSDEEARAQQEAEMRTQKPQIRAPEPKKEQEFKFYNPLDFVEEKHFEEHKREVKEFLMLGGDQSRGLDKQTMKVNSNMRINMNAPGFMCLSPENMPMEGCQSSEQIGSQAMIQNSDLFDRRDQSQSQSRAHELSLNKSVEIKEYLRSLGIAFDEDAGEEEQFHNLLMNQRGLKECKDELILSGAQTQNVLDAEALSAVKTQPKFSEFIKKKANEKGADHAHIDQSITEEIEKLSTKNRENSHANHHNMINILEDFIDVTEPRAGDGSLKNSLAGRPKRNLGVSNNLYFQKASVADGKRTEDRSQTQPVPPPALKPNTKQISNKYNVLFQQKVAKEPENKVDQNALVGKSPVVIDIDESKKREIQESRISTRKISNDMLFQKKVIKTDGDDVASYSSYQFSSNVNLNNGLGQPPKNVPPSPSTDSQKAAAPQPPPHPLPSAQSSAPSQTQTPKPGADAPSHLFQKLPDQEKPKESIARNEKQGEAQPEKKPAQNKQLFEPLKPGLTPSVPPAPYVAPTPSTAPTLPASASAPKGTPTPPQPTPQPGPIS